jgi:hypothetical protein
MVKTIASEPESIEALQRRHRDLERRKIQAESDLRNLEKQLADAKAEALRLFQTDDVEGLRDLLRRMSEENLRKRRDYQAHLDAIAAGLAAVEAAHGEAAAEPAGRN